MMTNNMPSDRVRGKKQIIQKFLRENAENALIMRKTHFDYVEISKVNKSDNKAFPMYRTIV